jgi:hypothetical protein
MECRSRLCLIKELNLLWSSGWGCMKPCIPNCASVLLITLRLMVRPRESIKFLRICWELVLCSMEEVGIRVYRIPSFPTTIAIKREWTWRRSRCYMVVGVEPHCFRVKRVNERFLDLTYYKKSRDKFIWWVGPIAT